MLPMCYLLKVVCDCHCNVNHRKGNDAHGAEVMPVIPGVGHGCFHRLCSMSMIAPFRPYVVVALHKPRLK